MERFEIRHTKGLAEALAGKVEQDDERLSDPRAPTAHNHDDRYYTEQEIDAALAPIRALIGNEAGDADAFINTVREVLTAFANSPEGFNILSALAAKANSADLATVARTGSYNDLLNKPAAQDLSGYATQQQLSDNSAADRNRANHTGTQMASTISDFTQAVGALLSQYDAQIKGNAPEAGNTLGKLYNLILAQFSEVTVPTTAARDALSITQLPTNVFVLDDGDGRWALYHATSTGQPASFVKLSDPDLLGAQLSAAAIKQAYESNPDTNAFTDALLAKLQTLSNNELARHGTGGVDSLVLEAYPFDNDVEGGRLNSVVGGADNHIYGGVLHTIVAGSSNSIYAGLLNNIFGGQGNDILGGEYNTIINCSNASIPASCSNVTLLACINFDVPAGTQNTFYINNVAYALATAGGPAVPVRDVYDIAQTVRDAVAAGSFQSGELQGSQPAGSEAGDEFTTTTYGYKFQRGAAGTLVWCRYSKG